MLALWFGHFAPWELLDKVRFDKANKLIRVVPGTPAISIRTDIYSAAKRWAVSHPDNTAIDFPIRTIGGDPTIAGQRAGDLYFMQNGWRVVVDFSETAITGVLFSDDFDTAYVTPDQAPQFAAQVSSLVSGVEVGAASPVDEAAIAGAVRVEIRPDLTAINEGVKKSSLLVPHTDNLS